MEKLYLFIYYYLPRIAKHLQRRLAELAVISNFHHQRAHREIELGIH